jgi:hypothetical protein
MRFAALNAAFVDVRPLICKDDAQCNVRVDADSRALGETAAILVGPCPRPYLCACARACTSGCARVSLAAVAAVAAVARRCRSLLSLLLQLSPCGSGVSVLH